MVELQTNIAAQNSTLHAAHTTHSIRIPHLTNPHNTLNTQKRAHNPQHKKLKHTSPFHSPIQHTHTQTEHAHKQQHLDRFDHFRIVQ